MKGTVSPPSRDALQSSSLPSPLLVKTDQRSSSHVSQQQCLSSLPSLPASHELAAIATANLEVVPKLLRKSRHVWLKNVDLKIKHKPSSVPFHF